MRITHPKRGEKRITTEFRFTPLRIGLESRWLETVTYEEEFCENYPCDDCWIAKRFIDK
jgi:hypothetical protein